MSFTLTQLGYMGTAGPVFTADAGSGKLYGFIYDTEGGVTGLRIKEPEFMANLGQTASLYTLGSYSASQRFDDVPTFKQPTTGTNFSGFDTNVSAMVTANAVPSNGGTTTTTTTTGTTTGTTVKTDATFAAPTVMEQVTTFLTNYWWLVLLVVGFLLWKPFLAPALGFSKKKRR